MISQLQQLLSFSTGQKKTGRKVEEILAEVDSQVTKHRNLEPVLRVLDSSRYELLLHFQRLLGSEVAGMALTLKVLNLCLSKYHFRAQSTSIVSRPFGLILDPSNFCNLQCPACVHSPTAKENYEWPAGTMDGEHFGQFVRRYGPYATQMMLCNYGEPLLNRNTPSFIRQAKSYLMRTSLSTSLSVGKIDADAYVNSGLDFMIMSIDGATQPVYEQYRRNGNIEYVYQNIRKLVEARERLGRQTPILHWQFLAFEHNEHEIPLAIERARELGVDQFHIITPNDVSWDVPHIKPSSTESRLIPFAQDISNRLQANANPFPEDLDVATISAEFAAGFLGLIGNVDAQAAGYEPNVPSEHTCRWIYTNMTIDATRRIIPCCAAPAKGYDLVFATFGENVKEEVFNSEKYRLARLYFSNPKAYSAERALRVLDQDPHCVNCVWDQEHVNVSNEHVNQYLRDIAGGVLNDQSMQVLCSW